MGAYLIAGLVKPGPSGGSPKNNPPPTPGGMTKRQFNKEIMKCGRTSAEARARMGTITRAELEQGGVSLKLAKKWRNFYREENLANPTNPSAAGRADLMHKVVKLLKQGK